MQEERAEVREPEVARISSLQIPTSRAMGDSEVPGAFKKLRWQLLKAP